MKKLTTFFILVFIISAGLFANPEIPKNNNPGEIENAINYYDDSNEAIYKLYAVTYNSDSVNLISLHMIKTSLITNIETSLIIKFETEEELDEFIDYSYIESEYMLDETPDYFSHLKMFISNMGIQPFYVMDENDHHKKIIYTAFLSKE